MLAFLEGTLIPDWLDELRTKLDSNASSDTLDRRSAFARKLVYLSEPFRPYEVHDETLDELITALLDERELEVTYSSRNGERHYTLQPLALIVYRRALYLLARKQDDPIVRRLPVERFLEAKRGASFRYPKDFDPEAFVANSFGIFDDNHDAEEVRLRFHADVADLVRSRRWHATEAFEDLNDGRLDLVMRTQGAELGRLALEWGDRVEVVSPPHLRERVQRELTSALHLYTSPMAAS
jgi:predicted DNA-binding transcriptional regulator YafY